MTEPVIGLPLFRQPPGTSDEPLPTVPAPDLPTSPPASPLTAPLSPETGPSDQPERPPLIQDPAGLTRPSWVGRGHGSGDPRKAGRMLAGLLAILFGSLTWVAYRRGRWFRQPTNEQMDDFTLPLGRILVRYLPLELIGPTLTDATEAAAAGHQYLLDGPMTGRFQQADPNDLGDET